MSKQKLTKKELREKQIAEDKIFRRKLHINFCILLFLVFLYFIFHVFWCDIKLLYYQTMFYGKIIPAEQVCMTGDKLLIHKGIKKCYRGKTYVFCNRECYNHLIEYFKEDAFAPDYFTGDTLCKADALIGLKNRGKPEIIYFKSIESFNQYYKSKNR